MNLNSQKVHHLSGEVVLGREKWSTTEAFETSQQVEYSVVISCFTKFTFMSLTHSLNKVFSFHCKISETEWIGGTCHRSLMLSPLPFSSYCRLWYGLFPVIFLPLIYTWNPVWRVSGVGQHFCCMWCWHRPLSLWGHLESAHVGKPGVSAECVTLTCQQVCQG